MPPDMNYEGYVAFIEKLPLVVDPEVFNLHENANITKDMGYTNNLFASILLTQSSSGGGGGDEKSQEDVTYEVAEANLKNGDLGRVLDELSALPEPPAKAMQSWIAAARQRQPRPCPHRQAF